MTPNDTQTDPKPEGEAVRLKPCPFCGRDGEMQDWSDMEKSPTFFVRCVGCLCDRGVSDSVSEAIAAWNRRTQPAPARHDGEASEEFVERVENAIDDAVWSIVRQAIDTYPTCFASYESRMRCFSRHIAKAAIAALNRSGEGK